MTQKEIQEIIKRWVKQPPSTPLVQYLRDSEKISAWKFINGKEKVLDIASESNVTLGIKAKYITRVDVSLEASSLAKNILKDVVQEFVIIDPRRPILPFPKDSFDAAVSIGPYDWLFLDIIKLTDEVYRVVKENGIFVFSVPTIKSPYCTPESRNKFRYFTIPELKSLIDNSKWDLKDFALIYQPPRIFYVVSYLLWKYLPSSIQAVVHKPLIKFCQWMTKYYTHKALWSKASYIVVVLEKRGGKDNKKNINYN